jgi:hypothetical protein
MLNVKSEGSSFIEPIVIIKRDTALGIRKKSAFGKHTWRETKKKGSHGRGSAESHPIPNPYAYQHDIQTIALP